MIKQLTYEQIQTPKEVWVELLKLNPIDNNNEIFLEPFAGENSLFDLVECTNKDWCEITKGRDIFDYDFENSKVTCIYTNPPYKHSIPNKDGTRKYKNCCYYFLELFMSKLTNLQTIGFIMNMNLFNSLTPKRLAKLKQLGFTISSITLFNCNFWYGLQFFIVFNKRTNNSYKFIETTFIK